MKISKICKAISIGLMLALLLTQLTFVTAFADETYTAEQIITGTNGEVETVDILNGERKYIYDVDVSKGYFYKFDVKFKATSGAAAPLFSDNDGETRMRFEITSSSLKYPIATNAAVENKTYTHTSADITYHYIIAVAPNDTITYYRAEDNGKYQKVAITDSTLFKIDKAGELGLDIRGGTFKDVESATASIYYTKCEKEGILSGFEQTNATNKAVSTFGANAPVSTLFDENKKWATSIDITFNDDKAKYVGYIQANNYKTRFQAVAEKQALYLGESSGTELMKTKLYNYTIKSGSTHNFIVVMTSKYCDLYAKPSTETTYTKVLRRLALDWKTAGESTPWQRKVMHGSGTTGVTVDKVEVYSADVDNNLLSLYDKVAENTDKTDFNYIANATDDMAYQFDVKLADDDDTFSAYMYLPDGEHRARINIGKSFMQYTNYTPPAEGETVGNWVGSVNIDNTPGVEYSYIVKIIDDKPYYYRKVKNSNSGYVLVAQGNALQEDSTYPKLCVNFATVAETVTCTASVYTSEHPTEAQLIGDMDQIEEVVFTANNIGDNKQCTDYPILTDKARVVKFDYKLLQEGFEVVAFVDDGTKRCRIGVKHDVIYYTDGANAKVTCSLTSEVGIDYTILVYINEDDSATWYRKAATDTIYTPFAKSTDLVTTTYHRIRNACANTFTNDVATATVTLYQEKANLSFVDSNGADTDSLAGVESAKLSLIVTEGETVDDMMIVAAYNGDSLVGAELVPITKNEKGVYPYEIPMTDVAESLDGVTKIRCFVWTDELAPVKDLQIGAK